jgi:hypothetical protein
MSLAAGPGRGGGLQHGHDLVIDKHVAYIQKLDTVRHTPTWATTVAEYS